MNDKGFTMVELLVAMAIMGLLMIMAFPTMRAIQLNNQKKKFESYGESVLSAAKLYVNSYSEDLFDPDMKNNFQMIYLSQIKQKGLIKDINISDASCINGQSNVVIVKYNKDYNYCLHLTCTNKDDETSKLYESENTKGSCNSFTTTNVTYKYEGSKTVTKKFEIINGDDAYKLLRPEVVGFSEQLQKDQFQFDKWDKGEVGKEITINGPTTINLIGHKYYYKIKYNKSISSASGDVEDSDCQVGKSCPLRDNNYKITWYTFKDWIDGSSNHYTPNTNVDGTIGKTITKDNQIVYLSTYFRKNILTLIYNSNGGSLTPGDNQQCPIKAGCKKNECKWKNPPTNTIEYATGCIAKTGTIMKGENSYDGTGFVDGGLRGFKKKSSSSLYMTKNHYDGTDYWLAGSSTSTIKINEATKFSKSQDFAKAAGYEEAFKNGDVTVNVYAEWNPKKYKLTYKDNGGSGCSSKSITKEYNNAWGDLCTPTRTDYTFVGWKSGSTTITKDTKATSNIEVTAEWKISLPTCTINVSSGTSGDNGWYKSDVTLTMKAEHASSYGLTTKNSQTFNGTKTATIKTEGSTTYYGFVKNSVGTNKCSKTIKMDKTPPSYSVSLTGESGKTSGKATGRWNAVKYKCTDNKSGCTKDTDYKYVNLNKSLELSYKDKAGNTMTKTPVKYFTVNLVYIPWGKNYGSIDKAKDAIKKAHIHYIKHGGTTKKDDDSVYKQKFEVKGKTYTGGNDGGYLKNPITGGYWTAAASDCGKKGDKYFTWGQIAGDESLAGKNVYCCYYCSSCDKSKKLLCTNKHVCNNDK